MLNTRFKTECDQDEDYLCMEPKSQFPELQKENPEEPQYPSDQSELSTNFGITVSNPYCFILLHLRNKSCKNEMHINIPEVCIFYDKSPYDTVYSAKGFIRGHKTHEAMKMKLKDVNRLFKDMWITMPKNEPVIASFSEKEMLMLSENDLFAVCCKTKADPFFKKLHYFRNKIPANNNNPIKVQYYDKNEKIEIVKLANESLMGLRKESEILLDIQVLSESAEIYESYYLQYLNNKMCLYLKYEHNIRVKTCNFVYIKTNENQYYFVNAFGFDFTNLTLAIQKRHQKLALQEEERCKILIMTPEKEARFKSYESLGNVQTYEKLMTGQFNSIVYRMKMNSLSENKREQVKNELAFKKLHPKAKLTYTQVITSPNFIKVKDEILQSPKRKPLTVPSRYVMRYYNKIRSNRINTEPLDRL